MEYDLNTITKDIDAAMASLEKVQKCIKPAFDPVKKLQESFKKFGDVSGVTTLATSITHLGGTLQAAWKEAGKLVSGLTLFKTLFLDVATQNESLARSMANVTGSAAGAKAALAAVQASLRGWDTEDAAKAYMTLKRAGLGTSEEDLKKLGDIAGHTNNSLTNVAEAMVRLKDGDTSGLEALLDGNIVQFGNSIVAEFSDAEGKLRRMGVELTGNAAQDANALQQLMNEAVDAKGMKGGAERFGQSWEGMVQRAQSGWQRFVTLIMDNGPFALLKEKFAEILAVFDEMEADGTLQALADEWAKEFCKAIESLWESGKALVAWFKSDFLPAFQSVKEFLGGWGGVFKVVGAIMVAPFIREPLI